MKTILTLAASVALTASVFIVGCSSASGPATSGVNSSKTVRELSAEDMNKLCDYAADWLGGYGNTTECTDNGQKITIRAAASQAECVAGLKKSAAVSACTATAEDVETVARSIAKCKDEPGATEATGRVLTCSSASPSSGLRSLAVALPLGATFSTEAAPAPAL